MRNFLHKTKLEYLREFAKHLPKKKLQFVVLTHILLGAEEFIAAIQEIADIALVIAIPYSTDPEILKIIKCKHKTVTPDLEALQTPDYLYKLTVDAIAPDLPLVIFEIGGYYSPTVQKLTKKLQKNFLGVIEDTESGHRRYEKAATEKQLTCPVFSAARSPLKNTEDFIIGTACLYAVERILRNTGFPIQGKHALVVGFGKIGKGVAYALRGKHCHVTVYDINPLRRLQALSEGFTIPDKKSALAQAEMLFGATGRCSINEEDFPNIKNGAMLVSCSSRNIEFDLAALQKNYKGNVSSEHLTKYTCKNHTLYLANNGEPVNFSDRKAIIGPMLCLVQAELISAIQFLLEKQGKPGIFEIDYDFRMKIAAKWFDYFCDNSSGRYRHI